MVTQNFHELVFFSHIVFYKHAGKGRTTVCLPLCQKADYMIAIKIQSNVTYQIDPHPIKLCCEAKFDSRERQKEDDTYLGGVLKPTKSNHLLKKTKWCCALKTGATMHFNTKKKKILGQVNYKK